MPARFDALAGFAPGQPTGADLIDLRLLAGLTRTEVARWTGLHRTTLRRQERGQARVCLAAARLLAVLAGVLPWPAWHGWVLRAGVLIAPHDARVCYRPGELAMVTFAWQTCAAARAELRRLGTSEDEIAWRVPAWSAAA